MIYTDEIMARAVTVWPLRTVDYSQACGTGPADPDGHPRRADCSEYVAMCWRLVGCTWSTVNLVDVMTEIPQAELRAGDAIGRCGPGTGGNVGHIMLVDTYDPATGRITGYEQRGGPPGPTPFDRVGLPQDYRAYRFDESTVRKEQGMGAWLAQDETGIAVVWPAAGEVLVQNIVYTETVAGWNAAGVPGPFAVPSIAALGRIAPVATGDGSTTPHDHVTPAGRTGPATPTR